jgi:hypothetical protein
MRIALMLLILGVMVTGCYQVGSNGDDDLRGVPVTNNPNIIPESGLGPMNSMPY